MFDRRPTTFVSALFAAALFVFAGCASEPKPKPQKVEKAPAQKKKAVQVKEPTPEELANSPCGNPDWAQLPPGAEDKAPSKEAQPAEEGAEPADTPPSDAQPAEEATGEGEQSSKVELYPKDQPCT
ncbi:hypothetical protein FIV42_04130 [Persicimonas caeni]|uniref:Secreted protein n=1 Tax=Persicimonas caeni TaxID=2292766 RepID=A0A4Y6PNT1_PERCE|nr:hypothetical protein [Persicimonas caeni]QDG49954.1 hypothetical protein FIV42_04130 [Persicimonas caeni]QED31175.1 hypothetical protein FRD00_04125 [Persicimonas caeni]